MAGARSIVQTWSVARAKKVSGHSHFQFVLGAPRVWMSASSPLRT